MRLFDESHDIVNNLKESLKLGRKEKYKAQIAHISQVGIIKTLIREQQMSDIMEIFSDIVKIDSDIIEAKLKTLKFDDP